jgi:hypothetical protein
MAARRTGRPKAFNKREVERAAEKGLDLAMIAAEQGIPAAVLAARSGELQELVAAGNARHRAALTRRLYREAVGKGRSHALLAGARRFLGYDDPTTGPDSLEVRFKALLASALSLDSVLGKLFDRVSGPSPPAWALCPRCGANVVMDSEEGTGENAPV